MSLPVAATSLSARSCDQPAHFDRMDDDEQADEEEDRDPFDLGERSRHIVGLLVAVMLANCRAASTKPRRPWRWSRPEMKPVGKDQGHDDQRKNGERTATSSGTSMIAARAFIVITRSRFSMVASRRAPPQQMDHQQLGATAPEAPAGATLSRKALNDRPASEPIMILGGSPIRVAAPPILEAMISANRNG